MSRPEFNLAGTVPEVHGLGAARKSLADKPREEVWVIGRVVNLATTRHHPTDEPDQRTMVLKFTSLDAVVIPDDVTTIQELVARARAERPGQPTLEDAAAGGKQEAGS